MLRAPAAADALKKLMLLLHCRMKRSQLWPPPIETGRRPGHHHAPSGVSRGRPYLADGCVPRRGGHPFLYTSPLQHAAPRRVDWPRALVRPLERSSPQAQMPCAPALRFERAAQPAARLETPLPPSQHSRPREQWKGATRAPQAGESCSAAFRCGRRWFAQLLCGRESARAAPPEWAVQTPRAVRAPQRR